MIIGQYPEAYLGRVTKMIREARMTRERAISYLKEFPTICAEHGAIVGALALVSKAF